MECPKKWQADCPKKKHWTSNHHIFYPASKYGTELEVEFRELPQNRIHMCRYVEEQLHLIDPNGPPIPSIETMEHCIELERQRRELRGGPDGKEKL